MSERIAIVIGDPNGIGPEIAVKAAVALSGNPVQPILVGDRHVIDFYVRILAPQFTLAHYAEEASVSSGSKIVRFADVPALKSDDFRPGVVSAAAGRATVAYVAEAVAMARASEVGAIVGCPHSETAVNRAGIPFSGYPRLIGELTQTPADRIFMMLVAAGLRIAHVTLHEGVQTALSRMTTVLFETAGAAAIEATKALGIAKPRLGVMGINPHASEGTLFGDDDANIVVPAVQRLQARGYDVEGPVGADLLLAQRRHDVYLAPFHDQGHIPVKLLSPLRSSALTIGVPVRFSSVGHGSAHDIAGRGEGDPASVLATFDLLSLGFSS